MKKIKILVEADSGNNDLTVIQPSQGLKAKDILETLGCPIMNVVLDVCDNDEETAIKLLTCMMKDYAKANDIDLH